MTPAALSLSLFVAAALTEPTPRPALGVLVVFDQLRAADLERLAPLFGPGGFGGLEQRGAARFDAAYNYAATETGPGHATIATGASPSVHGVASNRWPDGAGGLVYVVADPEKPVLGGAEGEGASARFLKVPTLGDVMKMDSAGKSRVVTASLKDRAAILLGGRGADLAFWYDPKLGRFTSSAAYVDALPTWLDEKGRALPEQSQRTGAWSPLPTPRGLEHLIPVDDRVGEQPHDGASHMFPHDLARMPDDVRRRLYRGTPQAVDDLLALALQAVDEEKLGQDTVPDLLCVSISATDFVGHGFGPGSLEYVDLLRRIDQSLRQFFAALDRRVGARRLAIALTADHGVTPLPEASAASAGWGARISVEKLEARLADVAKKIAPTVGPIVLHPPHVFTDLSRVPPPERARVLDALAEALASEPGVAHVYRVDTINDDVDPYVDAYRAVVVEGRSGPLLVRQEPRVVFTWGSDQGTDHGTPYAYDARVPFLLAGPDVRRGRYAAPVDVRDVAPSLAYLLGVTPPDGAQGTPVPALGAGGVLPFLSQ